MEWEGNQLCNFRHNGALRNQVSQGTRAHVCVVLMMLCRLLQIQTHDCDGAIEYPASMLTTVPILLQGCAVTSVLSWISRALDLPVSYRNTCTVVRQCAYMWMIRVKRQTCDQSGWPEPGFTVCRTSHAGRGKFSQLQTSI